MFGLSLVISLLFWPNAARILRSQVLTYVPAHTSERRRGSAPGRGISCSATSSPISPSSQLRNSSPPRVGRSLCRLGWRSSVSETPAWPRGGHDPRRRFLSRPVHHLSVEVVARTSGDRARGTHRRDHTSRLGSRAATEPPPAPPRPIAGPSPPARTRRTTAPAQPAPQEVRRRLDHLVRRSKRSSDAIVAIGGTLVEIAGKHQPSCSAEPSRGPSATADAHLH